MTKVEISATVKGLRIFDNTKLTLGPQVNVTHLYSYLFQPRHASICHRTAHTWSAPRPVCRTHDPQSGIRILTYRIHSHIEDTVHIGTHGRYTDYSTLYGRGS